MPECTHLKSLFWNLIIFHVTDVFRLAGTHHTPDP
jgi:hypothetical protein